MKSCFPASKSNLKVFPILNNVPPELGLLSPFGDHIFILPKVLPEKLFGLNNCSCSPSNINVPLLENFNIADIVCAPPAKIPPHINQLAKPSTNDLNTFPKIVLKLSPLKIETISELITLIPPDIKPAIAAALNPIPSAAKNEPPVNTVKTAPITIHIAPITNSFQ